MEPLNGLLNLDKPAGISSAAAVARVKRLLPRGTKIGHAGTLDPFATGVLVLLVGRATKLAETVMGQPKQYEATIKLDATTPTLDPESHETPAAVAEIPSVERVREVLAGFVGEIQQRPPAFSAIKIDGRRAYDLARKGQEVEIAARPVTVYGVALLDYGWPLLKVRIDCGRGTYIRSMARDIGAALGAGGYLTELRRTRVGDFWTADAAPLDAVERGGVSAFLR